ncbi:MAG: hypothetical protein NT175_00955 [Bacteroidetes bacterium]|nr:hypothetical protein [Bacteroidota bacterium]
MNRHLSLETGKLRPLVCTIAVVFLFLLFLSSCKPEDPEALIPSYIRIDTIKLISNPDLASAEGSLSHNITDAWVYVDEDLLGAFELPVQFPVLKDGLHTLKIRAGIKINGIAGTRGEYPFYESYSKEINMVKDSVIIIYPVVKYKDFTVFDWVEDFEDGQSSLVRSSRSDTTVRVTSQFGDVFEGEYSGIVYMDDIRIFFEALTQEAYVLPRTGEDVYLEMNFRTNNNLTVGIFANEYSQAVQSPVVVLNATDNWKKIYINLTNAVNNHTSAIDYNVFIGALKQDDVTEPVIMVDNLKLLH